MNFEQRQDFGSGWAGYSRGCVWALAALAVVLGCGQGGDTSAEVSPPGSPGTFTQVYGSILATSTESRCNFCHSMPASQVSNGMFHMGSDKAETYASLLATTSTSNACAGREIVVPGDPEQSLLFLKVAGQPPCGNRMPLGGQLLTEQQVQLIESWIAAGANDD